MITKENYDYLMKNYGMFASWAVWASPGLKPKSNMRDVSIFDSEEIIEVLHSDVVFIGLNGSTGHDDYMDCDKPWHNFHSSSPHGNDYKLRYATMDTPLWGAYITDAIVDYKETDSNKVAKLLDEHPEIVNENMNRLKDEFAHLGKELIIIALGDKAYSIVSKYFNNKYRIFQLPHYSYTGINKEQYRDKVLDLLHTIDEK